MSTEETVKFRYSSYKDGELWCEDKDPAVVLNHSAYHDCTFKITTITTLVTAVVEDWYPVAGEM